MTIDAQEIIAWQPVLTDHQAYTYQELSIQSRLPLTVNVMRLEDATRKKQGWTDASIHGLNRILIPKKRFFRYCIYQLFIHRSQIHIFGSAFESYKMFLIIIFASILKVNYYIISESYSPVAMSYFGEGVRIIDNIKAVLRPILYRLYILLLRKSVKGVFSISKLSIKQLIKSGLGQDKIFPFGYFVPAILPRDNYKFRSTGQLRLIFVGSLIPRKGLNILLEAVAEAKKKCDQILLDVYGPGSCEYYDLSDDSIQYRGVIPFGHVQNKMQEYDLMVLPSKYDGWGVVVNEAICSGLPVVCSNAVGASVLVEKYKVGEVFESGDSDQLANILCKINSDRKYLKILRSNIDAARSEIQPKNAAAFMMNVFISTDNTRSNNISPWYKE